jgi:hypothetical protein
LQLDVAWERVHTCKGRLQLMPPGARLADVHPLWKGTCDASDLLVW